MVRILRKLWNEHRACRAPLTPEEVLRPAERALLREVTWTIGGIVIVAALGALWTVAAS